MSLINDVLRDLEARRGDAADPLGGVWATPAARRRRRAIWVPVAALPLAAAALVVWQRAPQPVPPEPARVEPAAVAPPVAAVALPVAASGPAAAATSGIRLETVSAVQDADRVRLLLGFDQVVEHRSERSDDGRTLALHLPGVRATAPLPPLAGLVAAAELREDDGGAVLALQLADPVEVQTSLERRGDGASLSLVLVREPPQPAAAPVPATPPKRAAAADLPAAAAKPERPARFSKEQIPPTPAELAAQGYAEGARALRADQSRQAEAAFREALTQESRHVSARQALAQLLVEQGRLPEAERMLREGLAAVGQAPPLVQQLARLLVAQQRDADAVRVLEAGLPAAAGEGEHLALLAAVQQRQGRFARAAELYGLALRSRPAHGPWRIGQAIALESAGERTAAADAYRAALQSGLSAELRSYALQRVQALNGRRALE